MGHYAPFSVQASLKAQQSHSWPGGTGPVFLAGGWGLLTREHFSLCWVGGLWSELMYETAWGGWLRPIEVGEFGVEAMLGGRTQLVRNSWGGDTQSGKQKRSVTKPG